MEPSPKTQKKAEKPGSAEGRIAVVRVRGVNSVRRDLADTLRIMRLHRKNYCVVLPDTPSTKGMLQKAKDFITWGPIDEQTFNLLVQKRGEAYLGRVEGYHERKFLDIAGKKIKPYFRLHPPVSGYDRKGIKTPVSMGGALGNRGERMKDLILRMVQ